MDTNAISLTVFFQEPFWIGVFERVESGRLSACKVTFGAEPKDYEVHEYLLKQYSGLHFSSTIQTDERKKGGQSQAQTAGSIETDTEYGRQHKITNGPANAARGLEDRA